MDNFITYAENNEFDYIDIYLIRFFHKCIAGNCVYSLLLVYMFPLHIVQSFSLCILDKCKNNNSYFKICQMPEILIVDSGFIYNIYAMFCFVLFFTLAWLLACPQIIFSVFLSVFFFYCKQMTFVLHISFYSNTVLKRM